VDLLIPNIAVTEFGNGTWTMVYDEGFFVEVAGFEFFAFNAYLPKPGTPLSNLKPEYYHSLCHETLVGWYHENHRWGCWGGHQIKKQFPNLKFQGSDSIKSNDIAIVAPPEHRGEVKTQNSIFADMLENAQNSLEALFDTQISFIELDAKLSGRSLAESPDHPIGEPLWQAYLYPELKGKLLRDLYASRTAGSIHKLDLSTWESHITNLLTLHEQIQQQTQASQSTMVNANALIRSDDESDEESTHPSELWSQFNDEVDEASAAEAAYTASMTEEHLHAVDQALRRGEIPQDVADAMKEAARVAEEQGAPPPPPPYSIPSEGLSALMPPEGYPVTSPFEFSQNPTADELEERIREAHAEARHTAPLAPLKPNLPARARALTHAAANSGVPSAVTPAARIDQRMLQRTNRIRKKAGIFDISGSTGENPPLAPLAPNVPGGAKLELGYVGTNYDDRYGRRDPNDENTCEYGLPCKLDWRNRFGQNWMSGVRNQGSCGSCYAMALMAVLESRFRLAHNDPTLPRFSPQNVVSCSVYNQGCDGGFPFLVAKHIEHFGAVQESCYRYTAADGVCQMTCPKPPIFPITNTHYIGGFYGATNEETMMRELMNGPIAVAFESPPSLFAYRGGIFTGPRPQAEDQQVPGVKPWQHTNHAIVAVGWGESMVSGKRVKYWIMRNTWGKHWGEEGYFRIRRGTDECGVESMAVAFDIVIS